MEAERITLSQRERDRLKVLITTTVTTFPSFGRKRKPSTD